MGGKCNWPYPLTFAHEYDELLTPNSKRKVPLPIDRRGGHVGFFSHDKGRVRRAKGINAITLRFTECLVTV
jgi:predicted alpha/beta-fold hydrolase